MPVLGFLDSGSAGMASNLVGFHKGLAETGYIEGKNIAIARNEGDIDTAFTHAAQNKIDAIIVASDDLFIDRRKRIIGLTMSHAIRTIFSERDSVVDGGLMSYSASLADSFRQVGVYAGRKKPADLPVLQPTKFDLTINLSTAKALGLGLSPTLLALADEVIE